MFRSARSTIHQERVRGECAPKCLYNASTLAATQGRRRKGVAAIQVDRREQAESARIHFRSSRRFAWSSLACINASFSFCEMVEYASDCNWSATSAALLYRFGKDWKTEPCPHIMRGRIKMISPTNLSHFFKNSRLTAQQYNNIHIYF